MKLHRFSNNTQIPNFIKICPVGVDSFYVDRRAEWEADTTKLKFAFLNFVNVYNKSLV